MAVSCSPVAPEWEVFSLFALCSESDLDELMLIQRCRLAANPSEKDSCSDQDTSTFTTLGEVELSISANFFAPEAAVEMQSLPQIGVG